ncbi:MAG: hypothetical protein ABH952_04760 [Candidatus Omnitrophota bacterium]
MLKSEISKRILYYEVIGFTAVILILWLDEIWDVPGILFGLAPTPINLAESVYETIMVLILAGFIILFTIQLIKKVKFLEGLLPTCSVCKKIRMVDHQWVQIEEYISRHSEAEFTHSYCPECRKKLYEDGFGVGKK